MPKPQYGARWRRVRLFVLERDGWECRIRLPGCRGRADCVDHVTPHEHGGTDDSWNLRAACTPCNSARSNMTRGKPNPAKTEHRGPSRQW